MKHGINFKTSLLVLAALSIGNAAHAQGAFSGLKDRLEKKAVEEISDAVIGQSETQAAPPEAPQAAASPDASVPVTGTSLGEPAANLIAATKCANLKPTNIIIGNVGDYTFQEGFSVEERSGLINRKAGALSHDCILPSLESRQIAYMEVDTAAYEAMGNSNDWEMQCVRSADPAAGAVGQKESKTEYPYKVTYLSGKDMMLHCGNSEGIDECAEGKNSHRSGAWDAKLKDRGTTMLSVHGNASTHAPAGGEKLYCQYYNKPSRMSLFAFEYMRTRN